MGAFDAACLQEQCSLADREKENLDQAVSFRKSAQKDPRGDGTGAMMT